MKWIGTIAVMLFLLLPTTSCVYDEAGEEENRPEKSGIKGGGDGASLENTGVKSGLVVHVGCGDGKKTAGFGAREGLLVQGLDRDPENVAAARRHVDSMGLYGRVTIGLLEGDRLPYADGMVNLIIVEDGASAPDRAEILRVLAPRGVALVGDERIDKPVPSGIGEWTHHMQGPENNAMSGDTGVGFPKFLQWDAGPGWARHHSTAQGVECLVSSNGRLVYFADVAEGSIGGTLPDQWRLIARDAFNGMELWSKTVEDFGWNNWTDNPKEGRFGFPRQRQRRLVLVGDRVYATLGFNSPVAVLDAATGEILRTLEGTELCSEILCHEGLLYLAVRESDSDDTEYYFLGADPESGKILWKSGSYKGHGDRYPGLSNISLVAGGDHLFFLDEKATVCLDAGTGRELWRSDASHTVDMDLFRAGFEKWAAAKAKIDEVRRISSGKPVKVPGEGGGNSEKKAKKAKKAGALKFSKGAFPRLIHHEGVVYLLNPHAAPNLSAVSAETGKTLWQKHKGIVVYGTTSQLSIAGGRIWVWGDRSSLEALDLENGETVQTHDLMAAHESTVGHIRCYPEKGTQDTLWTTIAGKAQQYIELDTGKICSMPWLRAGCRIGVLPCNGMVYITPHPCVCYSEIKMKGFLGLASKRTALPEASSPRLEKGPSYGRRSSPAEKGEAGAEWPMFRHDGTRGNRAGTTIGESPKQAWSASIGGKLTQPVVSGGMAFVASVNRHQVVALDAETGKVRWTYRAGGRIDSPPTCHGDKILFGSADGHVYALWAADGSLCWKYRVAPGIRTIVSRGQLESAWPVHGSVFVHEGKIVAVAGRTTYLDGGIVMCLLDPETGEASKETRVDTTGLERPVKRAPGLLPDILTVRDGTVAMRYVELAFDGPEIRPVNDGTDLNNGGSGKVTDAQKESPLFIAGGGMLNDGFFHRSGMMIGASQGQILAFDGKLAYFLKLFPKWNANNGPQFVHGTDPFQLICEDPSGERKWEVRISQVPRALLVAGDKLVVGGSSDEIDPADPWKAYEGRGESKLVIYSAKDGSLLTTCNISSMPVFDGMSAAGNRLFVSCSNGEVLCWK